jgi:hypothetical protein
VKLYLVGPTPSETRPAVTRPFQERGDSVSFSDQVPPDADVYLFCTGHEAMRHLTHGLVILDLRSQGVAALESAPWAPYADLCLVGSAQDRLTLMEIHACEPGRIFLVTDDATLVDLVDKARWDMLPPAEIEKRGIAMADRLSEPEASTSQIVRLAARIEAIERQADVMQRGYRLQSKVPVLGPLIAWVRRNLTSHLREPYLDPTLERQVAVNRELVTALRELLRQQSDLEARLARLEEGTPHD